MSMIPILKMRKQRHRDVTKFTQGFPDNTLYGAGFRTRVLKELPFIS